MTQSHRDRPSVLLLHGLGGTGETLAPLARAVKGHGFTVAHPTLAEANRRGAVTGCGLTLQGLLDEARGHASRLVKDGRPPIICGHSNGALLAYALAAEDRASALVLMAPVPPASVPTGIPAWLQSLFLAASFGPCWRTGALHFERRRRLDPDPPPDPVARTLLPDSGAVLAQAIRLAQGSRFDPAPPLGVPVSVVAGARDRIIPPKTARNLADHFGAEYHLVAEGGHWFPAEARFSGHLAGLVARLDDGARDGTDGERAA